MIPTKITVIPDTVQGRELVGFGKGQMRILKRQRELGLKDEHRTVSPFPGVVVECFSGRRIEEIVIHTGLRASKEGEEVLEKAEKKECFCFPHFTFGIIKGVTEAAPGAADLREKRFYYDVSICAKDRYILYEGAIDANFGMYFVGQFVLVTIGQDMDGWAVPLDCDRGCLVNGPRFDNLMISPIHIDGKMKVWK